MTDETTTLDDAADTADFASGFSGEPVETKEKPAPEEAPREEAPPAPEYVQITAKDWAELKAVAAKTASYDQQLSKLFGTTGNLQKLLNESKAKQDQQTPAGRKIEISKAAFAEMERDFPELAQQTRAALEAALSGVPLSGTNDVDPAKIEAMLASYTSKREFEALEDAHPDWRTVVGAVSSDQQPDLNHPFRKWLSGKDEAYQNRINASESAAVLSRAIRLYQTETKATPKPTATPRSDVRADRIRGAVLPKGDNAPATSGKTEHDDFLAGFNSR